jgi:putative photosynthetic complex assembly protein
MSALDTEPFPTRALVAAAALIGFSMVATAVGRYVRVNTPPPVEQSAPAPSRAVNLRFIDETDGSVTVRNSDSGVTVANLAPGTNGFIRGVMRGLARERRSRSIGAEPPFRLAAWPDGRLTLDDTATGRRIDLNAFGISNQDAFEKVLDAGSAHS